jgi:hypothetical protein
MAVTIVNGAAGTIQVKLGGGQFYNVVGIAAGTSYAYTIKDGPDQSGNFKTLFGATPLLVVAGQNLNSNGIHPISFVNGLAFTVSGTPGEFEVQFD